MTGPCEGYALLLSSVPRLGPVNVLQKGVLLPEDHGEAIVGNGLSSQAYPSADRWTNKMYPHHTMGHSTMRRKEALTRATAWVGYESIAFSGRSHTHDIGWFCLY